MNCEIYRIYRNTIKIYTHRPEPAEDLKILTFDMSFYSFQIFLENAILNEIIGFAIWRALQIALKIQRNLDIYDISHIPIYALLFFSIFCNLRISISRNELLFFTANPIAEPAASPMQQTTGMILYDACAP